jgi:hypothetical protein
MDPAAVDEVTEEEQRQKREAFHFGKNGIEATHCYRSSDSFGEKRRR